MLINSIDRISMDVHAKRCIYMHLVDQARKND